MTDTQVAWLSEGVEVLLAEIATQPAPDKKVHFDVVIIGSGYGGAIAAAGLAWSKDTSGNDIQIAVLERGKEYLPGMFPASVSTVAGHARVTSPLKNKVVGNRNGLFDIRAGGDINAVVANGLGGGSLINAGVMEIPAPAVFDERWPSPLRGGQALAEYYTRVRERLGASRGSQLNTVMQHPELQKVPLHKFRSLQTLGGGDFHAAAITVAMTGGPNNSQVQMSACKLCGDCATGCNFGAKDSLDVNLLVEAKRANVRLFTGATVLSLSGGDEVGWTIEVIHTLPQLAQRAGAPARISASKVILAAGTFGSTEILLRSRDRGLTVSGPLGARFSGNGDMIAVGFGQNAVVNAVADEALDYDSRRIGPTITGVIDLRERHSPPLVIEEMAVPGPLRRVFEEIFTTTACLHDMATADTSRHKKGNPEIDPLAVNNDTIQKSAIYAVMGDDGAAGTIALRSDFEADSDGGVTVNWKDVGKHPLFPAQISTLESLAARSNSGGRMIPNPLWNPLPKDLDALVGGVQKGPLLTVHPLGGCVMGDDDMTGVVDHFGRVFAGGEAEPNKIYRTLAVLDGSIIPSALGTNPALTIAAVAARAVEGLISDWELHIDSAGEKPDFENRPIFRDVSPPPPALPTTMRFVERLRGKVYLNTRGGKRPYQAEITLYFADKALRDLYACSDDTEGTKHTLTVEAAVAPANMISRLRLFDQTAWENARQRGFSGREMEEELERMSLLTAPLTGKLTIMGRHSTRYWPRVIAAGLAWLANRGLRDGYQSLAARYSQKKPRDIRAEEPAVANKPSMRSLMLGVLSRAGEVRLFDYDLKVGTPVTDKLKLVTPGNNTIRGTKEISYRHRSNPLDQLSTATLSKFPGLARLGEPAVLVLGPEFLARKGLPLFRIVQQQDAPQALVDLLSFTTYFVRLALSIHLLTFRLPDTAQHRVPNRLPGKLPGLPDPECETITVVEGSEGPPQPAGEILLTRYRGKTAASSPVMLIHGYSASGTTFAHPALKTDLTRHLWRRGRDVWILDMRSSCGAKTATVNYSFEHLAATDIPIAVDHICRATGRKKIDIVAHCMGAAMFSMAVLDPYSKVAGPRYQRERRLLPGRIRRAALSQVGPLVTMSPRNIFLAYLFSYLKYYLPLADYSFSPPSDGSLFGDMLDRLLAATPYPDHEFDLENPTTPWRRTPWVRTRHRMDLLYGCTFSLANVSAAMLQHIDDFFGPLSVETATQVVHFAKYQSITNRLGFNDYVARARFRRYWCFPTLSVHGKKNGLADSSTVRRMETILKDAGCDYRATLFDNVGHQDSLIGKDPFLIFEEIEKFLAAEGPLTCPMHPPENEPLLVQVPWSGPVIGPVKKDAGVDTLPVSFGYNPALSEPQFVVVIPLAKGPGQFKLLVDDIHTLARCQVYPAPTFVDGWGKMLLPLVDVSTAHSLLLLLAYDEAPELDNALFGSGDAMFDSESFKLLDFSLALGEHRAPEPLTEHYRRRLPALVAAVGICLSASLRNIEAGIVRVPPQGQRDHLNFALGSCQYPPGIIDQEPGFRSYRRLAEHIDSGVVESPLDLVLLTGDQVYVDPTAGLADPKAPDEHFLYPYQNWHRSREVRRVLRQLPSYMLLDDHEIADNWEPLPNPDEDNLTALALGRSHYLNFQRGPHHGPEKPLFYEFQHNGFHFFVADTRTLRECRSAADVGSRSILGISQTRQLDDWLQRMAQADDPQRPKFIVCPAMFAPRSRRALQGKKMASAIYGDGWDGYPASFTHFLQQVATHKLQNLILLSGDAHLSCVATIALQTKTACLALWSVHASPLFAPYPFADSMREDLMEQESFSVVGSNGSPLADCYVNTEFSAPGDGFAILEVKKVGGTWQVRVRFKREAGDSVLTLLRHIPPLCGCAPPAF